RIYLIGRNFEQRFIFFHAVTNIFDPFYNGALHNRLSHLGHLHLNAFPFSPVIRLLCRSSLLVGFFLFISFFLSNLLLRYGLRLVFSLALCFFRRRCGFSSLSIGLNNCYWLTNFNGFILFS